MFEVSFSQASRLNSFFLFVSALLRLVQWFVWASYRVRFVLSFCLFVCFSSDGQGWVRWYYSLLMIGFVFLLCLLFRWDVLHRVVLVIGWCQIWYSSGFLHVSSHYLILPRVSSLVDQGLGVTAPTLKAQGLITWQILPPEPSMECGVLPCFEVLSQNLVGVWTAASGLTSPSDHSSTFWC